MPDNTEREDSVNNDIDVKKCKEIDVKKMEGRERMTDQPFLKGCTMRKLYN